MLGYASAAGYLDHLAPEIHQGIGTSQRTDVWAFGMTVYRLLHGAVWYAESPPPRQVIPLGGFSGRLAWLPHVPALWRSLIRKTLHDDPTLRVQTATQLLEGLARLPAEPLWICMVSSAVVTWKRTVGRRRIVVTWRRHSPRRHQWEALSLPAAKDGRRRRLGASEGIVGSVEARDQLDDFFARDFT